MRLRTDQHAGPSMPVVVVSTDPTRTRRIAAHRAGARSRRRTSAVCLSGERGLAEILDLIERMVSGAAAISARLAAEFA